MQYLEPVLGGVGAFMLGFVWYTALFGKAWQAETGMTSEDAQKGMVMTYGLSLLMMIVMSFALNMIIGFHEVEEQTFVHGAFHGMQTGLFFAVPATAINYLYQKKSLKLFLIDASYLVGLLAVSGGIMAALKF
jgi:hypothetical protein